MTGVDQHLGMLHDALVVEVGVVREDDHRVRLRECVVGEIDGREVGPFLVQLRHVGVVVRDLRSVLLEQLQHVERRRFPYVVDVGPGTYAWCACGKRSKQPYCDGSHSGTGMGPVVTKIEEAKKVAWCGCKHSANGAFCDGSHGKL